MKEEGGSSVVASGQVAAAGSLRVLQLIVVVADTNDGAEAAVVRLPRAFARPPRSRALGYSLPEQSILPDGSWQPVALTLDALQAFRGRRERVSSPTPRPPRRWEDEVQRNAARRRERGPPN